MGIKQLIKRVLGRQELSNEVFIKDLRNRGIKIGEGTIFYSPANTVVDLTVPHMLEIGENVRITHGVTILAHDYSWSVLTRTTGNCLGGTAPLKIGNNVFIGVNATILMGSVIEDNVIIGAGSVVNGRCEANSVYAGNPAKRICSLETFYEKRSKKVIESAKNVCKAYYTRYQMRPGIRELREFQYLFKNELDEEMRALITATGYPHEAELFLKNHQPPYASMDALIDESLAEL